jgi:hypothetical protein
VARTIVYEDFHDLGGYTLANYNAKWSIFALGEMEIEESRQFDNHGLSISATPFRTGKDSGVSDHTKYMALSKQVFAVPVIGSITVAMDITAETPGTVVGRVVHGSYVQSGAPYAAGQDQLGRHCPRPLQPGRRVPVPAP